MNSRVQEVLRVVSLPALSCLVLSCLVLSSCRLAKNGGGKDEIEEAPIYVHVRPPEIRTVEEVIEVHGNLKPVLRADIIAETSGKVIELNAQEGDTVTPGQVLARLDDEDLRLNLRQAQSGHRVARSDYLSAKELYKSGMKSRQELEKLKRSYDDAATNLKMNQLRVEDATIKTPIAGTVISRNVEVFQQVGAMEPLYVVADLSLLKIDITVTESDVAKLSVGQLVRVRVDAVVEDPDSFPIEGTVSKIQPQVDPQTGTVEVEVRLPNPDAKLRPGMFARLKIVTALHPDAMVIPRRALVSEQGTHVWLAVEGGAVKLTEIKTGLVEAGGIEVLSGIGPTDQVIVDGQSALTSKSKIAVVEVGSEVTPESGPESGPETGGE